jgi:hypothetical protein
MGEPGVKLRLKMSSGLRAAVSPATHAPTPTPTHAAVSVPASASSSMPPPPPVVKSTTTTSGVKVRFKLLAPSAPIVMPPLDEDDDGVDDGE